MRVQLLNFDEDPRVPLLNFEGPNLLLLLLLLFLMSEGGGVGLGGGPF